MSCGCSIASTPRARSAETQVESLRQQMEEGRKLLVETQGEAEEHHLWRVQAMNRLMEAELENLRRRQKGWLQERSQHERTTRKLLAAGVARMPFLEQQIFELKGHKEALKQAH
ncbi:hypothetical protein Efla_004153 [Eimeria flavescens]